MIYFSYCGMINDQGARNLMSLMSAAVADGNDRLYLAIASPGGLTEVGFTLYNFIKSLPIPVTTHSIGYVDSAAVSLFLAGARRLASPISSFMLHQPAQKLPPSAEYTASHLSLLSRQLYYQEQAIAQLLKDNTSISEHDIRSIVDQGRRFSPEEAVDVGIASGVELFSHPIGAEVHFVGG